MTSNTDHTPGPWTCDGCEVYGSGIQVGSIYPAVTADEEMMVEANANLIAAAPELLAALQTFVDDPQSYWMEHLWDFAREAVDKATGGAA